MVENSANETHLLRFGGQSTSIHSSLDPVSASKSVSAKETHLNRFDGLSTSIYSFLGHLSTSISFRSEDAAAWFSCIREIIFQQGDCDFGLCFTATATGPAALFPFGCIQPGRPGTYLLPSLSFFSRILVPKRAEGLFALFLSVFLRIQRPSKCHKCLAAKTGRVLTTMKTLMKGSQRN